MMDKLKALGTRLFPSWRRWENHRRWQDRWNRPGDVSAWMNRGVSKEIEAAVNDGWFQPGSLAVDLGCGEGEVAYWLAADMDFTLSAWTSLPPPSPAPKQNIPTWWTNSISGPTTSVADPSVPQRPLLRRPRLFPSGAPGRRPRLRP